MSDLSAALLTQVQAAVADNVSLNIVGGNSKNFYGRERQGEPLSVQGHQGITRYEPTELVITARAGTSLEEIAHTLGKHNQRLPFEPPHYGPGATLGGSIACNFSGPARAYAGAARDYVLGTSIINGKAELLRFGGEVMKNVAGYDVSRLMVGAQGTLGVILDVSLKVLPREDASVSLILETSEAEAIDIMNRLAGRSVPLSGSAYFDGRLYLRLSGAEKAVTVAHQSLGGEVLQQGEQFWLQLREQQLAFFQRDSILWRISLPSTASELNLSGDSLLEWGGALRWLYSDESAETVFARASELGGHACIFRRPPGYAGELFQPLSGPLQQIQKNLKRAFDPQGIFNRARMYQDM